MKDISPESCKILGTLIHPWFIGVWSGNLLKLGKHLCLVCPSSCSQNWICLVVVSRVDSRARSKHGGLPYGPRLGAITYNFIHHKALGISLFVLGVVLANPAFTIGRPDLIRPFQRIVL
jgi:hypothetical protein